MHGSPKREVQKKMIGRCFLRINKIKFNNQNGKLVTQKSKSQMIFNKNESFVVSNWKLNETKFNSNQLCQQQQSNRYFSSEKQEQNKNEKPNKDEDIDRYLARFQTLVSDGKIISFFFFF